MKISRETTLINHKTELLKKLLKDAFISEEHTDSQSIISIKQTSKYQIHKSILKDFGYLPIPQKRSKFIWEF